MRRARTEPKGNEDRGVGFDCSAIGKLRRARTEPKGNEDARHIEGCDA